MWRRGGGGDCIILKSVMVHGVYGGKGLGAYGGALGFRFRGLALSL